MTYDVLGAGALDYMPCHYGTSKLSFRGPKRNLKEPYLAFLGGTQTFGKFIEQPYPLRVEHLTGVPSVNFGQINAGLDVFSKEQVVLEASQQARVTVIEVMGATNMSNLIYSVHPRRNDRFLRTTAQMRHLYPEVDFSQFNFTKHMLLHLEAHDQERFQTVKRVLQRTWVRKMRLLLKRLGSAVVLLRIGESGQKPEGALGWQDSFAPAFVTDQMIDALSGLVEEFVDVPCAAAQPHVRTDGLVFNFTEEEAVQKVAAPQCHSKVAQALLPVLDRLM
ncbi:MAG: DUF6473 family protein [Sulfitobacter sp.]